MNDEQKKLYLTVNPYALRNLRFAIIGYACNDLKIGYFPKLHATFYISEANNARQKVDLDRCTCGEENVPCIHMYRIALETGELFKLIKNQQVKDIIDGMPDKVYRVFEETIHGGYYEKPDILWNHDKKSFKELVLLGLLQGDPKNYQYTRLFLDNVHAFIYYTYTNPRDTYRHGQSFFRPGWGQR